VTAVQSVSHHLSERYGLRPRETWSQLIQQILAEHEHPAGASSMEIERWLIARPALLTTLLDRLVVSESFFFRHEDQMAILIEDLVTRLKNDPHERHVVWSAGCARGEEIYSVGLALVKVVGTSAISRVRLCGTDVSAAAIAQAKTGRFGAWSWRREPRRHEHVCFHDDGQLAVAEWLRDWVEFDMGLVRERADTLPSDHVDAVLFRNVAIYLTEDALAATYRALRRVLRPGGLLLVAPTDPPPRDFIAVEHGTSPTLAFRKPDRSDAAIRSSAVTDKKSPPLPSTAVPAADPHPTRALRHAMASLAERDYDGAAAELCRAALLFPDHSLLRYWSAYALLRGGYLRRAGVQLGALTQLLSKRGERELLEDAETTTRELWHAAERLQQELA
jgi:chemotaxis methyl-accepting protein methylase